MLPEESLHSFLTHCQSISLGMGTLQVSRGPEHFRHCKEVSMATLRAGTTQSKWLSKVLGERRCLRFGWHGTSELSPNNPKHRRIPTCPMKQKQQKHTYCKEQWPTLRGCEWPIMLQKPGLRAGMHQHNVLRKLQWQGSQGLKQFWYTTDRHC